MTFEEPTDPEGGTDESKDDATAEFFGPKEKPVNEHHLAPGFFDFTRNTTRAGVEEELRTELLSMYQTKGDVSFLSAPKINKELMPVLKLHTSALKRDEFKVKEQDQVGASILALGTGISELLKPEVKRSLPDSAKDALKHLADGITLLCDHRN